MRYAILRVKDERSSEICAEIEDYADNNGGITLPFSFQWVNITEEDAAWNMVGAKYDREDLGLVDDYEQTNFNAEEHYTHLFHTYCRCRLIPLSDDSDLYRDGPPDEHEQLIMTNSALAYSANMSIMESIMSNRLQDLGVDGGAVEEEKPKSLMEGLMADRLQGAGFFNDQRKRQVMTMNSAKRRRKRR